MKKFRYFMRIAYSPNNALITVSCRLRGGCERLHPEKLYCIKDVACVVGEVNGYREEIGCYACQIRLDAETLARAVRSHWGIENRDHYVRDVGEDDSRIRQKPGAMARIRSAALNILRANGIQNVSQALYINALNFISTPSTSYQLPQLRQATRARILMTRTEWPCREGTLPRRKNEGMLEGDMPCPGCRNEYPSFAARKSAEGFHDQDAGSPRRSGEVC